MARISDRRARFGLSHLARYASALGIAPEQINDAVIENFIAAVRDGSLHRKPNDLHRMATVIWNEVAKRSGLNLQPVKVPSFRPPAKRIEWTLLPKGFRNDVDKYLAWCGGSDSFAADARSRALAPRTLTLRRGQIHTAVTALVESGVKPIAITSIADLVSPENFKRILRRRHEAVSGRENTFNRDLAEAVVQIAREWVKVDAGVLAELRRLTGKVPMPASGLTDKNKRMLRQFDDPAALQRLHRLPERLWAEVKRDTRPSARTLTKAQAALAVAILSYMPLRLQNLAALTFDLHVFLREGPRSISSLELSAREVKNRTELAFDIPPHVARMLIEYRNRIAPKIIGHRPERVFVNGDGSPKKQTSVATLITTYLRKRAGIELTAHQFRHLSAKVLLDAEPGSFETVRQLLGHKNLNTTVGAYAGIDSRRAARHHQRLVEQVLADGKPMQQQKKWTS
jgi:integrase